MSAAFRRRHFVAGSPRASGGGEELRSCHREGPLWVDSGGSTADQRMTAPGREAVRNKLDLMSTRASKRA